MYYFKNLRFTVPSLHSWTMYNTAGHQTNVPMRIVHITSLNLVTSRRSSINAKLGHWGQHKLVPCTTCGRTGNYLDYIYHAPPGVEMRIVWTTRANSLWYSLYTTRTTHLQSQLRRRRPWCCTCRRRWARSWCGSRRAPGAWWWTAPLYRHAWFPPSDLLDRQSCSQLPQREQTRSTSVIQGWWIWSSAWGERWFGWSEVNNRNTAIEVELHSEYRVESLQQKRLKTWRQKSTVGDNRVKMMTTEGSETIWGQKSTVGDNRVKMTPEGSETIWGEKSTVGDNRVKMMTPKGSKTIWEQKSTVGDNRVKM